MNNPVDKDPRSILVLQALLYFDWWYTVLLITVCVVLDLFKLYALPYPQGFFSIEILILLIYLGLSFVRINYGMVGNRIESSKDILAMMFLSLFCVLCNVYFIWYQTYILSIDKLIQFIGAFFTLAECLIGLLALPKFF